jgi:hypothetical protein
MLAEDLREMVPQMVNIVANKIFKRSWLVLIYRLKADLVKIVLGS